MSLANLVKAMNGGQDITQAEAAALSRIENQFEMTDDDPLWAVVALMARYQLMADGLPARLEAAANQTIELHVQTLRAQSNIIAKELIADLGGLIAKSRTESAGTKRVRLLIGMGTFSLGFVAGALTMWAMR